LANVRIISQMLDKHGRSDIDIVGVGGVYTGKDAFELILCGAKAVQVGSCHWTEGSSCFERIANELQEIMKSKGYKSIEDFRGKLKLYDAKYAPKLRNLFQAKSLPESKDTATSSSGKTSSSGIVSYPVLAALELAVIVALLAVLIKLQYYP
jgi:dihydroorotate dehydrogenase (fumarate)